MFHLTTVLCIVIHCTWLLMSISKLDLFPQKNSYIQGLEKYLMSKLYSRTFGAVPEEVEHDQRVYEKVQLLQQFIRPEHLDILPKFQNETSWLVRIFCSHYNVTNHT